MQGLSLETVSQITGLSLEALKALDTQLSHYFLISADGI